MEPEDFEKLYDVLCPRLLCCARSQLDDATADDVVAATFETLWKKGLAFPGDQREWRRIVSLAHQVLKGHIGNEYRSRQRRASLWRRLASHHPGDEPCVEAADLPGGDSVTRWLSRLGENDRHVIALFHAGYSVEEMAQILRCSVAAATRRRDRARQRLRKIVSGREAGGSG